MGKKGVVRDRAVHEEVIEKIRCFALENGYSVLGLTYSPVKGPEGNIEYLIYLERSEEPVQNPRCPQPARWWSSPTKPWISPPRADHFRP